MKTSVACELLGLSLGSFSLRQLKKAYWSECLKNHPDRGGNCALMQSVNAAYALLSTMVSKEQSSEPETVSEQWYKDLNENHPLFNSRMPSFKSFDRLLREAFSIREGDTIPGLSPHSEYDKNRRARGSSHDNEAFFKDGDRHYRMHWYLGTEAISVADITDGGKAGVDIIQYQFSVPNYGNNSALLSNVMRSIPAIHKFNDSTDGFCWATCYRHISTALAESSDAPVVYGVQFQRTSSQNWKAVVDGVELTLSARQLKSVRVANPFTLKERYKPLADLTKKFTRNSLIKLLVNGQFYHLKREYYHTDDFAADAANRFSKQMLENSLKVAREWISDPSNCEFAYCHNGNVSFGFHSNDCSRLTVCLDNRLPVVDVDCNIAKTLGVEHGTKILAA